MLEAVSRPWETYSHPCSPLWYYIIKRDANKAEEVIANGGNPNEPFKTETINLDNELPIEWAAENGDFAMVRMLIRSGANERLNNALRLCIKKENPVDIVNMLFVAGADPNSIDIWGEPLLHSAIRANVDRRVIKTILEQPTVDINIKDYNGFNALEHVLLSGGEIPFDIYVLLVRAGITFLNKRIM